MLNFLVSFVDIFLLIGGISFITTKKVPSFIVVCSVDRALWLDSISTGSDGTTKGRPSEGSMERRRGLLLERHDN